VVEDHRSRKGRGVLGEGGARAGVVVRMRVSGGAMAVSVCVAGATGWAGRAVAEAVLAAEDLRLRSAVSRSAAGQDLGQAWGGQQLGVPVFGQVAADALAGVDVLVEFTSHQSARANTLAALGQRVGVVIGASGLTSEDFAAIDTAARAAGVGVIAAGNFSLTAALALATATLAARHLPSWEIIDYASAAKPDAPSGTAGELAERLAGVRTPQVEVPIAQTGGRVEARGATVAGTQIHSVRLPSFVVSTEIVFALPDQRLVIRHDAGGTPTPYLAGTLLALRAVTSRTGLLRGLDTLLLDTAR
jgi:4-hydroxy-tetrahydrodipicolinate reductase